MCVQHSHESTVICGRLIVYSAFAAQLAWQCHAIATGSILNTDRQALQPPPK